MKSKEADEEKDETVIIQEPKEIPQHINKKSLSNKEREEYSMLTSEIERLELRKSEINLMFGQQELNHVQIKELSAELAKIAIKLEDFETRWIELEERR